MAKKFKYIDPHYVNEDDNIAIEVQIEGENRTWEKAMEIIKSPPRKYLPYSLLIFRGVLKEEVKIGYATIVSSLNLKECGLQRDTLKRLCNQVYVFYSEDIDEEAKKQRLVAVISDTEIVRVDVEDNMTKEILEEVFTQEEKGIYIRDIAQLPKGHKSCLADIPSLIYRSANPNIPILPGVNTPMWYTGLRRSYTPYHLEDTNTCSINCLLEGSDKVWIVVSNAFRAQLTKKFSAYVKCSMKRKSICSQLLEHKIYVVTPLLLRQWGIPYKIVKQSARDLFYIRSGTYHTVVNTGRNTAEAVNFGSSLWNSNYDPPACECTKNRRYVPKDSSIVYAAQKTGVVHECKEEHCNRQFVTLKSFRKHQLMQHKMQDPSLSCTVCDKIFSKKFNLDRHMRNHAPVNNKKKVKCVKCGKRVKNIYAHNYNVHSDNLLKCDKCDGRIRKTNYLRHVENCNPICPHCNKTFRSTKFLKQHLKKHK